MNHLDKLEQLKKEEKTLRTLIKKLEDQKHRLEVEDSDLTDRIKY